MLIMTNPFRVRIAESGARPFVYRAPCLECVLFRRSGVSLFDQAPHMLYIVYSIYSITFNTNKI